MSLDAYCGGNLTAGSDQEAVCLALEASNAAIADIGEGINTFFLLFAGALVYLMQAGFAMLCAGSVRQKNVKNIMLKNLLDACGGAIGFFTVGYAFAYSSSDTGNGYIGTTNFFLADIGKGVEAESGYSWIAFFFQFAFAATAATIVAGTVAERCKMSAYLCYSLFLTGFVYPCVVHAVWSPDGWLTAFRDDPWLEVGVIDFAGSGVVHMTGGATALVAAIILGPRKGRFHDEDGNVLETPHNFAPHSVSLQVLGFFILWFGWYGFNPGSALVINGAGAAAVAGLCAVTTTLAAACGCVSAMFTDTMLEFMTTGEFSYDLTMAMNGALGGLVAITAGCSTVQPWAACIIGIIGGWVYLGFSKFLVKMRIDDAVDAIPVHFANGAWGVFAVGLFADPQLMDVAGYAKGQYPGIFYGGGGELLLCQFISIVFICAWVALLMTPFFAVLSILGMFRVDPLEEEVGLDISHHRGAAYDLSGAKKKDVEELMEVRASKHGKVEVPTEPAKGPAEDTA